jgi:DNA polymerase-3 subunit beta
MLKPKEKKMKIEINKQIIESTLINSQPFLDKKDATQITSHIFIYTEGQNCIFKSTDLEIGLSIKVKNITILKEGSFTVSGKKFLDIIRILNDDIVSLEIINDLLIIKQGKTRFQLPTFDYKLFPVFPKMSNKAKISLDSTLLIKSLKKIVSSIDNNNPKHELNGALIDIKKNITNVVATDTRRLSVSSIQNTTENELSIIIPKKAIIEIEKIFIGKIDIFYDDINLIIQDENYFLFSKLINGKYPNYDRIIPKEHQHNIKVPKNRMIEAMKKITIISQEINICFTQNKILFSSLNRANDNLEAKTQIEINLDINEEFELNFNSKYLLDFLSQVDSDEFEIGVSETTLPFIVKDKEFVTVIMPIVT